jgi:hypothetical protein
MWPAFKYQVRFVAVNLPCKDKIEGEEAFTQLAMNVTALKCGMMEKLGELDVGF